MIIHISWFTALILISITTSLIEGVLSNLTAIKAKQLMEKEKKFEQIVDLWSKHAETILATLYLFQITTNIFIFLYTYHFITIYFANYSYSLKIILTVISLLVAIGLFSLVPKLISRRKPDFMPLFVIKWTYILSYILFLPNLVFIKLTDLICAVFGIQDSHIDTPITEEEIKAIIEMGEEEGTVEESERKMIHSIFDFGETIVREVMIPRVDMITISHKSTLEEAVKLISVNHHSRIPVYNDNIDNIAGLLFAKDILDYIDKENFKNKLVKDIMHKPMFIPETKLISELLHELRETNTHLAIAVDEYGGTSGIITIEDILEEIIGEIRDEYDDDETELYTQLSENTYIIDAKIPIDEFKELLGIDEEVVFKDEGDYDTLGGYVFALLGNIPSTGQNFVRHNIDFEVYKANRNRVISLKVSKIIERYEQDNTNDSFNGEKQ